MPIVHTAENNTSENVSEEIRSTGGQPKSEQAGPRSSCEVVNGRTAITVREEMTTFWEEHSKEASINEMCLDSKATEISIKEMPEILGVLPPYAGKDLLELGAGIGRFTDVFVKDAASITAVDFMKSFIEKNREKNQCYGNSKFIHADVLNLDLPDNQYDLVFTNWLLMYLTDDEMNTLLVKCLNWLKEGGCLFIRESCHRSSGDFARAFNPTKYRRMTDYTNAILNTAIMCESERGERKYGYIIKESQPLQSYIELKNNSSQMYWLVEKVLKI